MGQGHTDWKDSGGGEKSLRGPPKTTTSSCRRPPCLDFSTMEKKAPIWEKWVIKQINNTERSLGEAWSPQCGHIN